MQVQSPVQEDSLDALGKGNGNPLQYSCLGNPMDIESLAGYSPLDYKNAGHDWTTTMYPDTELNVFQMLLSILDSGDKPHPYHITWESRSRSTKGKWVLLLDKGEMWTKDTVWESILRPTINVLTLRQETEVVSFRLRCYSFPVPLTASDRWRHLSAYFTASITCFCICSAFHGATAGKEDAVQWPFDIAPGADWDSLKLPDPTM